VFPYRQESYPPRGRIWPQWGDDVLEETLSISEGARQSLNRKREGMRDFHNENMQHHGLAPREPPREEVEWPDELYSYVRGRDDPASQPARPPQEPGGPQEELPFHLHETYPDAPAPPSIQRGASGAATPGAIHYGNDNLEYTKPDYQMSVPRGSVQEDLVAPGFPRNREGPMRAKDSFRIAPDREIGLATQATPERVVDMPVDDIANADIANRVPKRERDVKLERKVKVKTEPMKPEVKIKQEPGISHRGPGSNPSSTQPPPLAPDDEDLQTVSVNFNNNEDMSYWETQASGNEMKAQLNLRFPQLSGNWKYKSRPQLVSTIRGLIRKNQWVQGGSQGPVRASAAAERSTPYQRSSAADDDDDLQVGDVTWDTSQVPEHWKQQSANYIRAQLTRRFPSRQERHAFAFLTERQEYIDYILDLIRKGEW